MVKRLILFSIVSLLTLKSFAATRIATANGNWESSNTWGGTVPGCGDSAIIPVGTHVTINNTVDLSLCAQPFKLTVRGSLGFRVGKKLKLPCDSRIYIYNNGSINPGNEGGSSNSITICGTVLWTAALGAIVGTYCLPPDPTCLIFTLPVEFNGFSAMNAGKSIRLQWSTASEKDNDFFTVEKAGDDGFFASLARIDGAGNSHTAKEYFFDDLNPFSGTSFYRIRQTDYNGQISYSGTVAIKRQKEVAFEVFPNPSKGSFSIETGGVYNGEKFQVTVADQMGRIIYSADKVDLAANNRISLENIVYSNGLYIITVKGDEYLFTSRISLNPQ